MRALPALALSVLLIAGLSGCSVSVSDPEEPSTRTDNAVSDASEDSSETGSAGEPAGEAGEPAETDAAEPDAVETDPDAVEAAGADSDGDVTTTWSDDEAEYRDSVLEAVTRTLTCDGELVFGQNEPGQIVKVDGPCDRIVVRMAAGVVIAGEVGAIEVSGPGNVIYLDSIDTISVTGDGNAISWLGSTPQVTDTGAGNVITSGS
jgi:hypothetical protein